MSKSLSLLLLLGLFGCDDPAVEHGPVPRVRAAFALAAAERTEPASPDDASPDDRRPDPDCPRCHGSGTVPSGDGLARVPCGCLHRSSKTQGSKNQSDGAALAEPRVLVFSARWCPSCVAMKPALAAAGAGFEVVDVDAEPEVARAYGVSAVPTLVRLVDQRETARSSGARGVSGLRRFRDEGR